MAFLMNLFFMTQSINKLTAVLMLVSVCVCVCMCVCVCVCVCVRERERRISRIIKINEIFIYSKLSFRRLRHKQMNLFFLLTKNHLV